MDIVCAIAHCLAEENQCFPICIIFCRTRDRRRRGAIEGRGGKRIVDFYAAISSIRGNRIRLRGPCPKLVFLGFRVLLSPPSSISFVSTRGAERRPRRGGWPAAGARRSMCQRPRTCVASPWRVVDASHISGRFSFGGVGGGPDRSSMRTPFRAVLRLIFSLWAFRFAERASYRLIPNRSIRDLGKVRHQRPRRS